MKLQLAIALVIALSSLCSARRNVGNMMGGMMQNHQQMVSQMMGFNPFNPRSKQSEIDTFLNACLSPLSQSIDVVIDIKSWRSNDQREDSTWWPLMWRYSPMSFYDVADFVDALTDSIPEPNIYAVVVDGEANNQTRYYLNAPAQIEVATTTTPAPVTGYTRTSHNGGNVIHWWYQQTYNGPVEPQNPSLRQLLIKTFNARIYSDPIDFPTTKSDNAPKSLFTIVITDSSQKTPLSSMTGSSGNTVILDIGGKVAASQQNYLDRNILVVPESSSLNKFVKTVQFMICQAAGGNQGQVAQQQQPRSKPASESINVF